MNPKPIMNLKERQTIIAAHPLFDKLSAGEISRLAELMQVYNFSEQESIVKEGDPIDKVYLIASGEAEVTHKINNLEKSMEIPVAVLHAGDAIGLSDEGFYSKSGRRTATVTALTPVIALGISVPELTEFMQTSMNLYPQLKDPANNMLELNFIKNATPFAQMSHADIDWLMTSIEEISVKANTIIFKQGDMGDKCYLIKTGKVEIYKETDHRVLAVLTPPAIFGEKAFITGAPRNATVRTLEDSQLLALDYTHLRTILDKNAKATAAWQDTIQVNTIPIKISNPFVFPYKDILGDPYIVLKNDNENRYCIIPKLGWTVWEQINGKNSVRGIIEICTANMHRDAKDFVYHILKNLNDAGLIALSKAGSKMAKPSLLTRFLQRISSSKK